MKNGESNRTQMERPNEGRSTKLNRKSGHVYKSVFNRRTYKLEENLP
jgi:hypothetical protein